MMKIVKFLIFTILVFSLVNFIYSFGFESNATTFKDMQSQANDFISTGKTAVDGSSIKAEDITSSFVGIGQILTTIGAGVMVAAVTYMGIKYLTAGPETQAKLKQQLIGLVVAGVVIFGAYGIWKLVLGIVSQFD